jgi:hypothetical protein
MANDPFPTKPTEPTPAGLGEVRLFLIFDPVSATRHRANYEIEILDADEKLIRVERGTLFQQDVADRLRAADKAALVGVYNFVRSKAEGHWLP